MKQPPTMLLVIKIFWSTYFGRTRWLEVGTGDFAQPQLFSVFTFWKPKNVNSRAIFVIAVTPRNTATMRHTAKKV